MKTSIFLTSLFVLFFAGISANAQQSQTVNSELKKVFETNMMQWKQAYNSGDAQNLVPLYTEDAIYTSSHVAGLEAIGRDKLIANFQNGISGGGHIDTIEILKMEVSSDMAYLFCRYQATNSGVTVSGRNLIVLRKVDNNWVISIHMTVV